MMNAPLKHPKRLPVTKLFIIKFYLECKFVHAYRGMKVGWIYNTKPQIEVPWLMQQNQTKQTAKQEFFSGSFYMHMHWTCKNVPTSELHASCWTNHNRKQKLYTLMKWNTTFRKRPNCILPPCFKWWSSLSCTQVVWNNLLEETYRHYWKENITWQEES